MSFNDRNKNIASVILERPRITEKASILEAKNVYTFIVDKRANKVEIKEAVHQMYKVSPKKVRIVNMPSKKVFGRGRGGTKSGFKKALVFLNDGDKIDIV